MMVFDLYKTRDFFRYLLDTDCIEDFSKHNLG